MDIFDMERAGSDYSDNRAILGSEYCSGYIDAVGKWNTGFYCPSSDDNENIFCCGTPEDKFCCTKKDQVVQEEVEGITVLLGCMLGVLTACLMVTLAGCLVCPWCPAHRQRRRTIKHKSAVWNRLPHTDSGCGYSTPGSGLTSQSLPSLCHVTHVTHVTPHKSGASRDTVLHSPTLPHSLSDHIGLVPEDLDFTVESLGAPGSLSLAGAGAAELHFRNLHYTLPRGAYIVIPQHSQAPDILGSDIHKSYSDDNCAEDSLLFSTKF